MTDNHRFGHHASLGGQGWWDALWTHNKLQRNEPLQEDAEEPGRVWTGRSEGRDLENERQKKDRLKITGNSTAVI